MLAVQPIKQIVKGEIVTLLTSFGESVQAVVIGASGAIGGALVDQLAACANVNRTRKTSWALAGIVALIVIATVATGPIMSRVE